MALESIVIGAVGSVFDDIFGSVDKGHWEGSLFVPGDLQSRLSTVDQYVRNRGLSISDVDQNQIVSILKTPGIWQNNVQAYLDAIVTNKKATATTNANLAATGTNVSKVLPTLTGQTSQILAGFSSTSIIFIIAIAAGFFFLKKK
ncbi:MAG: hypothetical protein M0P71_16260 [Melioribacteraceae bacterium]|jgi:hypothetical protein|nr:hypothetical protein [Melioribacteraceae bacterium]